jgi:Xaa-Pro aminopeptidase
MPRPYTDHTEPDRRLKKLRQGLKKRCLDAMVIYGRENTYYLTGLRCSHSYLFISLAESVFYLDGRYIEVGRETVGHCDVRLMDNAARAFGKWQKSQDVDRIGFEGDMAWNKVRQWQLWMPGLEWVESGDLVRNMRIVKSAHEQKIIQRSARLNDGIYESVIRSLLLGMTEIDVRNLIHAEVDKAGIEGLSFDAIVAAGPMSSRPHYEPQARPLARGDLLLIDMGLKVDGYCSDMTRVVALGRTPKARLVRAYHAVLDCQQKALKSLKAGIRCSEIDGIARETLKKHRLARYFTHSLGHGVGLEIHEPPRLSSSSADTLRSGMVVTVEPGVYLPGIGGIRIEDLAVVTPKGCRILSKADKSFRVIPFG